jgi:hypothetical protein
MPAPPEGSEPAIVNATGFFFKKDSPIFPLRFFLRLIISGHLVLRLFGGNILILKRASVRCLFGNCWEMILIPEKRVGLSVSVHANGGITNDVKIPHGDRNAGISQFQSLPIGISRTIRALTGQF